MADRVTKGPPGRRGGEEGVAERCVGEIGGMDRVFFFRNRLAFSGDSRIYSRTPFMGLKLGASKLRGVELPLVGPGRNLLVFRIQLHFQDGTST